MGAWAKYIPANIDGHWWVMKLETAGFYMKHVSCSTSDDAKIIATLLCERG